MAAGGGRMGHGRMGGMGGAMAAWRSRRRHGRAWPVAASLGEHERHRTEAERHIGGFSIRKEDGTRDSLDLRGGRRQGPRHRGPEARRPVPPKSFLWYGYGFDPYCNLVDALDMAVPVFGPIALDEVADTELATTVAMPLLPGDDPTAAPVRSRACSSGRRSSRGRRLRSSC